MAGLRLAGAADPAGDDRGRGEPVAAVGRAASGAGRPLVERTRRRAGELLRRQGGMDSPRPLVHAQRPARRRRRQRARHRSRAIAGRGVFGPVSQSAVDRTQDPRTGPYPAAGSRRALARDRLAGPGQAGRRSARASRGLRRTADRKGAAQRAFAAQPRRRAHAALRRARARLRRSHSRRRQRLGQSGQPTGHRRARHGPRTPLRSALGRRPRHRTAALVLGLRQSRPRAAGRQGRGRCLVAPGPATHRRNRCRCRHR